MKTLFRSLLLFSAISRIVSGEFERTVDEVDEKPSKSKWERTQPDRTLNPRVGGTSDVQWFEVRDKTERTAHDRQREGWIVLTRGPPLPTDAQVMDFGRALAMEDGCKLTKITRSSRAVLLQIACPIAEGSAEYAKSSLYLSAMDKAFRSGAFSAANTTIERNGAFSNPALRREETQLYAPWNLQRLCSRSPVLAGSYVYNMSGENSVLFVLDTGVDLDHVEFAPGRAVHGFDAVDDGLTGDPNGHGTHVAGTAAGNTVGAARGTKIVDVRVLDAAGDGNSELVIAGLAYVEERVNSGIDGPQARFVINLSLGGDKSIAVEWMISELVRSANVVVVSAAGNDGADACRFSPSGCPDSLTVAATGMPASPPLSSFDWLAPYSNRGSCVDLNAPGDRILSASPFPSSGPGANRGETVKSGTSMAAPLVAGTACLARTALPDASALQIIDVLLFVATDSPWLPSDTGHAKLVFSPVLPSDLVAALSGERVPSPVAAPDVPRGSIGSLVSPLRFVPAIVVVVIVVC